MTHDEIKAVIVERKEALREVFGAYSVSFTHDYAKSGTEKMGQHNVYFDVYSCYVKRVDIPKGPAVRFDMKFGSAHKLPNAGSALYSLYLDYDTWVNNCGRDEDAYENEFGEKLSYKMHKGFESNSKKAEKLFPSIVTNNLYEELEKFIGEYVDSEYLFPALVVSSKLEGEPIDINGKFEI